MEIPIKKELWFHSTYSYLGNYANRLNSYYAIWEKIPVFKSGYAEGFFPVKFELYPFDSIYYRKVLIIQNQ